MKQLDSPEPQPSDRGSGPGLALPMTMVIVMCLLVACGHLARSHRRDQLSPISASIRLDINRADSYSLELLPMIGPHLAQAIVQYRREHGPFDSVDELIRVKRIGPITLARVRVFVICGGGGA